MLRGQKDLGEYEVPTMGEPPIRPRRSTKEAGMLRLKLKKVFIRALAEFLVANQVRQSIELEMGKESAKEWAALRSKTTLHGYPTIEEAEQELTEFLM